MANREMMFVPPRKFSKIFISLLIFFFLTGCKNVKQNLFTYMLIFTFAQEQRTTSTLEQFYNYERLK